MIRANKPGNQVINCGSVGDKVLGTQIILLVNAYSDKDIDTETRYVRMPRLRSYNSIESNLTDRNLYFNVKSIKRSNKKKSTEWNKEFF